MRNEIMDALMAVLKSALKNNVRQFSRRYRMLDQVPAGAKMPYLMLTRPKESYPARVAKSLPPKRTFNCEITIYFSDGQDQAVEPDRTLASMMDNIDLAFRPPVARDTLTLGGLVDHCYIEGDIICVPGDVDGLGMLSIPVIIVVP